MLGRDIWMPESAMLLAQPKLAAGTDCTANLCKIIVKKITSYCRPKPSVRYQSTTYNAIDGELWQGSPGARYTLANPFDAAIVNDERTMHGVTPIFAGDPAQQGYRDVLVITFNKR